MKANELTHIKYTKTTTTGEVVQEEATERYIIPTFVPLPNIKAIDVTDLSEDERAEMIKLYDEYTQYYQRVVSTLFTFEDWLSHTGNEEVKPGVKWRTFRLNNVLVLG